VPSRPRETKGSTTTYRQHEQQIRPAGCRASVPPSTSRMPRGIIDWLPRILPPMQLLILASPFSPFHLVQAIVERKC
jgi:hypothetical protein